MQLHESAVLTVSAGGWVRYAYPMKDYCGRDIWLVICAACARAYRVCEPADLRTCDCRHAESIPQPAA
jgi:hypothetical protein